jgi:hypothetical protein
MIRKLASGQYRLYSRNKNEDTSKRRNLGTFDTRAAAEKHEREVQYFKRRLETAPRLTGNRCRSPAMRERGIMVRKKNITSLDPRIGMIHKSGVAGCRVIRNPVAGFQHSERR